MKELSASNSGPKREGRVKALGRFTGARAAPERPGTTGTAVPVTDKRDAPFAGIIRVVPWNLPPLTYGQGRFFVERREQ